MNIFHTILLLLPILSPPATASASRAQQPVNIYDKTIFYDGYKTDAVVDADKEDGIIRFANYHYTKQIDPAEIIAAGDPLRLEVIIGAMCDNYDRLGRIILAFPPKGSATYDPESTERIEIARFITPFMNKNKQPDTVPFVYEIDDLRHIFADNSIFDSRDVWMEVELFGIPYSANKQIKGCADRNDVFNATVNIFSDPASRAEESAAENSAGAVILPVTLSKCEIHGNVNLNSYKPEATDTLGTTTRTYTFNVPSDLSDASLSLILTNHGAGEGGEEYIRRQHLVYFDGELELVYRPGGVSCEPYRKYNTQKNGIYSTGAMSPYTWRQFSNWCPGQAVPVRRIPLGALKAGEHTLMIRVPDAEFAGNDGDFRPSAYVYGVTSGVVPSPSVVDEITYPETPIAIRGNEIVISDPENVKELRIYSYDGILVEGIYHPDSIHSLEGLPRGLYIVVATLTDGSTPFIKARI